MATAANTYKKLSEIHIEERNELLLQELPQVHYIASRILERLPQQVELEDLVHAGVIGLLEAYRNFDPNNKAQFKTFAQFRIKGAILDSLRAFDCGSRRIRGKAREIAKATAKLENELGEQPSGEQLAAELNISSAALRELQRELHGLHIVGQQIASTVEGDAPQDLIESAPGNWSNPFELYCKSEDIGRLTEAVAQLSEREQLILSLYYREELTMREVAEVVNVAVARVAQIHTAALAKLKAILEPEYQSTDVRRSR